VKSPFASNQLQQQPNGVFAQQPNASNPFAQTGKQCQPLYPAGQQRYQAPTQGKTDGPSREIRTRLIAPGSTRRSRATAPRAWTAASPCFETTRHLPGRQTRHPPVRRTWQRIFFAAGHRLSTRTRRWHRASMNEQARARWAAFCRDWDVCRRVDARPSAPRETVRCGTSNISSSTRETRQRLCMGRRGKELTVVHTVAGHSHDTRKCHPK